MSASDIAVLKIISVLVSIKFELNHFTKLSVDRTQLPPLTFHSLRRYHSIDIDSFLADLQCSRLITDPPKSLGSLLIAYNTTLSSLFDKHAPVITRFSSRKSKSNPWFISTLRAF